MKQRKNSLSAKRLRPCAAAMLLIVTLCLLFQGCGQETKPPIASSATVSVYYLVDLDQTPVTQRDVIQGVPSALPPTDATPEQLLDLMKSEPENTLLRSPFPAGAKVRSCTRDGKRLTVDMTRPYSAQSGYDITRANSAIAMTLMQLPGVEEVAVLAEGKQIEGWGQTALRQNMVLLSDVEENEFPLEVALYFWDPEPRSLAAEYQTMSDGGETALAARLVQALIDGPQQENLEALLPRDTTLLSVSVEHRCCTLVLSDVFWQEIPDTQERRDAVLRSVVDSLKNLDFVDAVCFRDSNGQAMYGDRSLEQPLS